MLELFLTADEGITFYTLEFNKLDQTVFYKTSEIQQISINKLRPIFTIINDKRSRYQICIYKLRLIFTVTTIYKYLIIPNSTQRVSLTKTTTQARHVQTTRNQNKNSGCRISRSDIQKSFSSEMCQMLQRIIRNNIQSLSV